MTEEQYLSERVDHQIDWYSKKSTINKTYYLWANALVIVFAALIPFFAGFAKEFNWLNFPIAALGVLTAVATGLSSLYKFQEKWTTYRITAEALQREKVLFQTTSSPYDIGPQSFNVFVRNMEGIMNNENTVWTQIINKKDDKPGSENHTSTEE
jgi:uncharacterized protein DUF4231